jgi:uncharacterized membrane-anchored protein
MMTPRKSTDLIYWLTIIPACTLGETGADYLSHGLKLGYAKASVILVVGFVILMTLEYRAKVQNAARYWTAVVLVAMAGTTLADFFTRTAGFGYKRTTVFLCVALGVLFAVWRKRTTTSPVLPHVEIDRPSEGVLPHAGIDAPAKINIPSTDARYWTLILVVSTIGTTLGDYMNDGLDLGAQKATLILGAALFVALVAEAVAKVSNEARYWTAIVLTSTFGAASGDYLTHSDGLNLGFGGASALLIALFLAAVAYGRFVKNKPAAATN